MKEEDGMSPVIMGSRNQKHSSNCAIKSGVRERRVEVGRFFKVKSIDVFYYFEKFPTWLLLIDAFAANSITIGGISDMETFTHKVMSKSSCSVELFKWIIDRIGYSKFRFSNETDLAVDVDLCLLSGSLEFISNYLSRKTSARCLFVVDGHFGHRIRNGRPTGVPPLHEVTWHRVRHLTLEGPTSYWVLLGTVNYQIPVPSSELRRTIRDVWNASTRSVGVPSGEIRRVLDRRLDPVRPPGLYLEDDIILHHSLW